MEFPDDRGTGAIYWPGPVDACGICGGRIVKEFIDSKTATGRWEPMCIGCAGVFAAGIGPRLGQWYRRVPSGRWLRVAG